MAHEATQEGATSSQSPSTPTSQDKLHVQDSPLKALLASMGFVVGVAVAVGKTVREPLVLGRVDFGPELRVLFKVASNLTLILFSIHLYLSARRRTTTEYLRANLAPISVSLCFLILLLWQSPRVDGVELFVAVLFFLLSSAYLYALPNVFWIFSASTLTQDQGRAWFPSIGIAVSFGYIATQALLFRFGPGFVLSLAYPNHFLVLSCLCIGTLLLLVILIGYVIQQRQRIPLELPQHGGYLPDGMRVLGSSDTASEVVRYTRYQCLTAAVNEYVWSKIMLENVCTVVDKDLWPERTGACSGMMIWRNLDDQSVRTDYGPSNECDACLLSAYAMYHLATAVLMLLLHVAVVPRALRGPAIALNLLFLGLVEVSFASLALFVAAPFAALFSLRCAADALSPSLIAYTKTAGLWMVLGPSECFSAKMALDVISLQSGGLLIFVMLAVTVMTSIPPVALLSWHFIAAYVAIGVAQRVTIKYTRAYQRRFPTATSAATAHNDNATAAAATTTTTTAATANPDAGSAAAAVVIGDDDDPLSSSSLRRQYPPPSRATRRIRLVLMHNSELMWWPQHVIAYGTNRMDAAISALLKPRQRASSPSR